jgi:hypothetical protein
MTSTPDASGGSGDIGSGDIGGDVAGGGVGAGGVSGDGAGLVLSDPVAGASVGRLVGGVDGLLGREVWGLSDGDLAVLVQVCEVERRRLVLGQVAAVVEAGKRGLPARAGFGASRGVRGGDTGAVAGWVRSLVNVSRAEARRVAEVGAALFTDPVAGDLAETRDAALSGRSAPGM